jgi:hypothetical protein
MADTALANAQQKLYDIAARTADLNSQISAISAEIEALAAERVKLSEFIQAWHDLAGIPMPETTYVSVENAGTNPKPKRVRPKNPDRNVVVDAVLEVIGEKDMPMSRRALFEALKERGIEIQGRDPEMVLSTMLWRSQDRVVRFPTLGYWDAARSYPDADYVSSLATELFS